MEENTIQNALDAAARNGFTAPGKLREEIAGLANPQYRIAVVGRYQVGKSTLINRVFLKNKPILPEGFGVTTTSVCTEVGYGDARRLEVYDFEGKCINAVEAPGEDDVRKNTVGEDRKKLSETVSMVRIAEPNESLKSYTFIDTPGIDDPAPDLLINTTYRIIPRADLALLVIEPRMLDERETELLRKNLAGDGISRLMVLISFNPKKDGQDSGQRRKIVEAIQAQLRGINLPDVPVRVYCFNDSDEYSDTLNTPEKIEAELLSFLEANALAGRRQRIAAHVKSYMENCLAGLSAQIAAADKSEDERAELLAGIAARRNELEKQCSRLELDLDNDFDRLARKLARDVARETDDLVKKYKDDIENADSIAKINDILESMEKKLSLDMAEMFDKKGHEVQDEIRRTIDRRLPQKSDFSPEWTEFWDGKMPEIDPGFFAKIPNWLYEILNIVSLDALLPGGVVVATVFRVIQNSFSLLKKITLANLALKIVKGNVIEAVDASFAEIKSGFDAKFSAGFANIAESVKNELRSFYDAKMDALEDGLKNVKTADKTTLLNAKAEIKAAAAAL